MIPALFNPYACKHPDFEAESQHIDLVAIALFQIQSAGELSKKNKKLMSKYVKTALLKAHTLYTTAMFAYFWLFNNNLSNITQEKLVPLSICIIY